MSQAESTIPPRKVGVNVTDGHLRRPKSTSDPMKPKDDCTILIGNARVSQEFLGDSAVDGSILKGAFIFVVCCVLVMCIVVWFTLWNCSDLQAAAAAKKAVAVAQPELFIGLQGVAGLDPRESPPASPAISITLLMKGVAEFPRTCYGGGTSMLRVSYHGMILAWGRVPYFCVGGGQSEEKAAAVVEAKATAAVLREEVRRLLLSEAQVVGKVQFGVEGEVAELGYASGKLNCSAACL